MIQHIQEAKGKERKLIKGTTILCVKRDGVAVMAGDGQVTLENIVLKEKAKKIRKLYNDQVLAGFAGATADAFTLFERFEQKLEKFHGNITRASVELAKEWRTDRMLRRLEALMIVSDGEKSFLLSGNGDIMEPDEGIIAIGSGGAYALAAARALFRYSNLDIEDIVIKSMEIASQICIYTNKEIIVERVTKKND